MFQVGDKFIESGMNGEFQQRIVINVSGSMITLQHLRNGSVIRKRASQRMMMGNYAYASRLVPVAEFPSINHPMQEL